MLKIEQSFQLDAAKCQIMMNRMTKEMMKGLGKHTNEAAKIKMIPSFVTALPDGTGKNF